MTTHSMKHVMLDLGTLGLNPGCSFFSLGAVWFDPATLTLGPSYYSVVNRHSCKIRGLVEEEPTLQFWREQSHNVRGELMAADTMQAPTLGAVLEEFEAFINGSTVDIDDVCLWGNGAGFDGPILKFAYRKRGAPDAPWRHWGERCFRTLKATFPGLEPERPIGEPPHHALHDAVHQARWALAIAAAGHPVQ